MKVLIIEDELPAAERLQELILEYDRSIRIEGPLDSNEAVIQWFDNNEAPDLLFSDIELLDGPVFYALERLSFSSPIVFTTAYDQYALEAFQTNGIFYLLKPFDLEQLSKAMDKFWNLQKNFRADNHQELIAALKIMHSRQQARYKSRLTIKLTQGLYLLKVEDIACIRTRHAVAYAYKANGNKFPLTEKLSELQEQLAPDRFYRINRGEIVQVDYIEKVETYFNDRLAISITGQSDALITSAARTPDFRQWLHQL